MLVIFLVKNKMNRLIIINIAINTIIHSLYFMPPIQKRPVPSRTISPTESSINPPTIVPIIIPSTDAMTYSIKIIILN